MRESCYRSSNKIIGPCGPCSFINLIGLKGSPKLERELQESGRMKPFYATNFTSFLVWAEKYKVGIRIFVESVGIQPGTFKMMFKFEKILKEKQKQMKKLCFNRHKNILKRNEDKIFILKVDPIQKIDELLNQGYCVAFNMAHYVGRHNFLVGHLRVVYKRERDFYFIKDSQKGIMKIPKKRIKEDLRNLKVMGSKQEIIAYK